MQVTSFTALSTLQEISKPSGIPKIYGPTPTPPGVGFFWPAILARRN
ncbi:hypothetical protein PQBR44_0030 (plasmid) [Pseudomonas putida UWC1]|nr:hypothetical protein PQBR44_0030 [Pseudomonas putida UWC1]